MGNGAQHHDADAEQEEDQEIVIAERAEGRAGGPAGGHDGTDQSEGEQGVAARGVAGEFQHAHQQHQRRAHGNGRRPEGIGMSMAGITT